MVFEKSLSEFELVSEKGQKPMEPDGFILKLIKEALKPPIKQETPVASNRGNEGMNYDYFL